MIDEVQSEALADMLRLALSVADDLGNYAVAALVSQALSILTTVDPILE